MSGTPIEQDPVIEQLLSHLTSKIRTAALKRLFRNAVRIRKSEGSGVSPACGLRPSFAAVATCRCRVLGEGARFLLDLT
jgi:hypothetical protein